VAKVGEAEVMLEAAPPDLLVAYPVIGRAKLDRLMSVAHRARVTVSLDSLFAAQQLSEAAAASGATVGVLAEVDVGLGRVGVSPGAELLDLARGIERLPGLSFEGIAFYPGHIKDNGAEGKAALAALGSLIQSMLADFRGAGIQVRIVSGGSTPSLYHSHELPGLNEIRPGTYVYNDWNTVASGACTQEECAAVLLVTVVSIARPGQIIVDGGSKTFSSDRLTGSTEATFGHVVEAPEAVFHKMNEEHGYIDVRLWGRRFEIGEHLHIVPNHICVAVNLHERMYGIRNGDVEEVWEVAGRGKLQ
jgi:D-serine deaminase-like pyridoxal phosphate-dependent protein